MLALTLTSILAGTAALGDVHSDLNPVYRQLVQQGVSPDGEKFYPLPPPMMPDGLEAAAQRKVIESLGAPRHSYDDLVRKSTVAPRILRMEKIPGPDPKTPLQAVSIYFVAYGDMNALTDKDFLKNLGDAFKEDGQEEGKSYEITPDELTERGITLAPEDREKEGYGGATIPLLKNVELSIVGHSYVSQTDDSLLTAAMVDPRFTGDEEFPNVWRPLRRDDAGRLVKGEPQPYRGAGVYMKITRLAEPEGAMFVEIHVLYAEPHGWFNGRNLLGAKIPAASDQKVREMRQEILRASK